MTAARDDAERGASPLPTPGPRSPRIVSLNVSNGGVPKLPVPESHVGVGGLSGDWQKNRKLHGGSDRAVCLFSMERIEALVGEGHPIRPGAIGENVTVAGLEWERLRPGVRLRLGDGVLLEVTSFTTPCRTIAGAFADGRTGRVSQTLHPGWSRVYARVLVAGTVRVGDPVVLDAAAPR